jgi:hypothetical protein
MTHLSRSGAVRALVRRVAALAAPFPLRAAVAIGDDVHVLLLPTAASRAGVRVGDEPDGALLAPLVIKLAYTMPVAVDVSVLATGA